jgi:predicted DNA-binding transcriptional regulator AlpA
MSLRDTVSPLALVRSPAAPARPRRRGSGLHGDIQLRADEAQDRMLSYPEAEAFSSVSRDTLRREASAGRLEIIKLSARRCGIRKSELDRWIAARSAATAI